MMQGDSLGYYEALEIPTDAGAETIKQQYHLLAKRWHPDRNTDESAPERFQKISVAYNILKEPESRLKYDLLSYAYDAAHFPDMNNLKIYTSRIGNEEIDLRHIKLYKETGKILTHSEEEVQEICNYKEAKQLTLKTSVHNWLLGWWSLSGIAKNLKALMINYEKVLSDYSGNFTLLTHNMLAYAQEQRYDEAHACGRLALRYAVPKAKSLVEEFMKNLPYQRDYIYPQWSKNSFRAVQSIIPICLLIAGCIVGSTRVMSIEEFNKLWHSSDKINYFQEVRFNGGGSTVDDLVVSKVVSIPVNTEDLSNLYHLTKDCRVMYGPDDNFDVLKELPARTTVRLTGFTPDEKWARVMIDNGEMGFVKYEDIKRGIGKDIPEDSQIYTDSSL